MGHRRTRALLVVALLSSGSVGCELLVEFDRSEIDAGPLPSLDGSPPPEGEGGTDAANDTTVADSNQGDTNQADTNQADTNQADTNQPDSNQADAHENDASDAGHADAHDGASEEDANDGASAVDAHDAASAADANDGATAADANDGASAEDADDGATVADANDAASAADADDGASAADANDGAVAACNSIDPSAATVVTVADSPSDPPALTGGGIPTSGTWMLTDDTFYFPEGGSSGKAGNTLQQLFQISGTTVNVATLKQGSSVQVGTLTFTQDASAFVIDVTQTCPSAGSPGQIGYSIVGPGGAGTQLIVTGDNIEFQTFTQQ